MACITSGFIVTMKGRLFIPLLKRGEYFDVQLNRHVIEVLEGKKVRSVTITPTALSLCYSEKVDVNPTEKVYGVDRNEKNITFGDVTQVVQVDMRKTVRTRQTTREIISSFRRNDARIRRELARKYWRRANHRSDQILHAATNFIIDTASKNRAALAFEDLTNIRTMYRRANG